MQTDQGGQMITIQDQPGSQQAFPSISQRQRNNPQNGSKLLGWSVNTTLKLTKY